MLNSRQCSHTAQVKGYEQADVAAALKDSEIVLIPAGVPRKPGMTRDGMNTLE